MKKSSELLNKIFPKGNNISESSKQHRKTINEDNFPTSDNSDKVVSTENKYNLTKEQLDYYYNIKNPETGVRYSIPLLSRTDPDFVQEYANYMKMKENNPDMFDKILDWG